jgi:bifunctional ADP-heptose synthase (sugar kinase/adenylyltransferase)
MEKAFLQKILDDISAVRIALVGDFCLDGYWFIDDAMSEISVETGLATRPVSRQKYSLGGAGNVAASLSADNRNFLLALYQELKSKYNHTTQIMALK